MITLRKKNITQLTTLITLSSFNEPERLLPRRQNLLWFWLPSRPEPAARLTAPVLPEMEWSQYHSPLWRFARSTSWRRTSRRCEGSRRCWRRRPSRARASRRPTCRRTWRWSGRQRPRLWCVRVANIVAPESHFHIFRRRLQKARPFFK